MASLTIKRGRTEYLRSIITPVELVTGTMIYFMAKLSGLDADVDSIISKTSATDEGITVTDDVTGEIAIQIDPADTRALPNESVKLFYEIEIDNGTDRLDIDSGTLTVLDEVIQRDL